MLDAGLVSCFYSGLERLSSASCPHASHRFPETPQPLLFLGAISVTDPTERGESSAWRWTALTRSGEDELWPERLGGTVFNQEIAVG